MHDVTPPHAFQAEIKMLTIKLRVMKQQSTTLHACVLVSLGCSPLLLLMLYASSSACRQHQMPHLLSS